MSEEMIPDNNNALNTIMGWNNNDIHLQLLMAIEETGSINQAAKLVGIQYKSAWQKLNQISNLLPYPLLMKSSGGSGGGGSVFTAEGQQLINNLKIMQKEFSQFVQFVSEHPEEATQTLKTLRRIEMQLSARNVWIGKITTIEVGAVNSIIHIELKGGDKLSTVITDGSVKRLGLTEDQEVMAIVKAPHVLLALEVNPNTISARNILSGTISNIITGAVNDEITISLPGGSTVTSIITSASTKRLNLQTGTPCFALIKASDIILATV